MLKRWKVVLITVTGVLVTGFLGLMLDPFFRQWTFGPTYNGIPLIAWQEFFREWNVADPGNRRKVPTFLESVHDSIVSKPHPGTWKRLSGEDQRAILLTLKNDPQEIVRLHVASHLGHVPANQEVVAILQRYTLEPTGRVRQSAALSLGRIDPPVLEAIPNLLKLLTDEDPRAATASSLALGNIGSKAPDSVVPKLIPLLEAPHVPAQLAALEILTFTKGSVEPAIPALVECLRGPHAQVRVDALRVLGFIKAEAAVPQIINALKDPNEAVRTSAVYALRKIGPPAKAAVPPLIEQLRWLHLDRRYHHGDPPVLLALGSMGPFARDAIPELLKLRNHESGTVRKAVETTLTQIDPAQFPPKLEAK